MRRIVIVYDGHAWYVRRIAVIEHDVYLDRMVYLCDKPLSNDHATLADVPQVARLLAHSRSRKGAVKR